MGRPVISSTCCFARLMMSTEPTRPLPLAFLVPPLVFFLACLAISDSLLPVAPALPGRRQLGQEGVLALLELLLVDRAVLELQLEPAELAPHARLVVELALGFRRDLLAY